MKAHVGIVQAVANVALRFGWELDRAAAFVLAGEIPLLEPLTATLSIVDSPDEHNPRTVRSRARVILEFEPWVSERTVAKAYRWARSLVLGSDQHLPTPQQSEVHRFVVRRLDEKGNPRKDDANPKGSWVALGREWNRQHAADGWKYTKPVQIKKIYDSINDRFGIGRPLSLRGLDEPTPLEPWTLSEHSATSNDSEFTTSVPRGPPEAKAQPALGLTIFLRRVAAAAESPLHQYLHQRPEDPGNGEKRPRRETSERTRIKRVIPWVCIHLPEGWGFESLRGYQTYSHRGADLIGADPFVEAAPCR